MKSQQHRRLCFIDTEVGIDNQRVQDFGAIREDGVALHTNSEQQFLEFVAQCDTVCGHNILCHDLKYLHLQGDFIFIDTLLLSPLLFPSKPYHKLLKDDKLQVEEFNNPLNDAMKARDLFHDEVEAWRQLTPIKQEIYSRLLAGKQEFSGFLSWVGCDSFPTEPNVVALIRKEYEGKVCSNSNRMKQKPIVSVSPFPGLVDTSPNPQISLSDFQLKGTTAVLTVTNEQALQVAYELEQQGKHVRLIQAADGFRFVNLAEVRYFFKQIGQNEEGVVGREAWVKAKQCTEQAYATSRCLDALRRFFADFESTHRVFYPSDLREFALESSIEDFVATDDNTVFVSTIHKAKGREFDTVHLILDGIREVDPDMLRATYVGITRARHQLFVYKKIELSKAAITISLTMHDVWLDFFRARKEKVLRLRSGDRLNYHQGYLIAEHHGRVASLSNAMRDRLKELESKGYAVTEAEVSYVLAWRPPEEAEEVAVCLANLVMKKHKL